MEDKKLTEGQQIIEDTLKMFLGQSIYKEEEKKDDQVK